MRARRACGGGSGGGGGGGGGGGKPLSAEEAQRMAEDQARLARFDRLFFPVLTAFTILC